MLIAIDWSELSRRYSTGKELMEAKFGLVTSAAAPITRTALATRAR